MAPLHVGNFLPAQSSKLLAELRLGPAAVFPIDPRNIAGGGQSGNIMMLLGLKPVNVFLIFIIDDFLSLHC